MQRLKMFFFNLSLGLNCLLFFLLIFEERLVIPAWVQVLGRMHPLLLHFPIVLMVLCIFWELFAGLKKIAAAELAVIGDGLLLFTSITAVSSALMGLLLSKETGYIPEALVWHKWGGVFISLLSLAWYVFRHTVRQVKIVLALTGMSAMVIVMVTGHLGAGITHGENFLLAPVIKDKPLPAVLFEDAIIYTHMVQPILTAKCVSCHNEKKAKGELLMEPFALLLKGGKSGVLWDSTEKDFGLLLRRIRLPMDNKKHMPPAGKPQLTDEEINIIYHWIKSGASATATVAGLSEKDTLRALALSIFKTIETDDYTFKPADEKKIKSLSNNYRLIAPLAVGSPALGVEFFSAAQFKASQLKELLALKEQVVSLNLNKMPVTDDELKTIARFVNLRTLNLSFTNIKGSGLSALNQLKELKQLSLSGTGVNVASLAVLASLPKLKQLYIWSTPAQSQNLTALQHQFKNTFIQTGFKGDTVIIKLNEPIVENEEQIVLEPVPLKLKHFVKGVTIRYTTDGTAPDSLHSPIFKGNFMVDKNMTVKAKAYKPGWISSGVTERAFYKAGYKIDSILFLKPPPDPPYKSISTAVLKDEQKGDLSFSSGKWIGFKGQSMQAIMYLKTSQNISSVTVSHLVDINSYIMPPLTIEVWGGSDPGHLRLIKKIIPLQPVTEAPAYMKGYDINFAAVKEKCFKVVVIPVSKLPAWHRGKGDKGWIFVDEIFLN